MTVVAFQEHFREIAPRYSSLRGLDARAVRNNHLIAFGVRRA